MNVGKVYILILSSISLSALPVGLRIDSGSASVQMNSNSMAIVTDDGAALNWTDFSILEHESVEFIQPHSQAIVLNRVVEQNPSQILGALSSNGKLVLVNPNGMVFGEKSRIDLPSFIASTFDIHDEFFKGQMICKDKGGEIHFSGKITAKDEVYFFAKNVGLFDHSSITAAGGKVFIGKGEENYSHVQNAEKVYLSPGSTINVDAQDYGNGGTILLWGDLSNQAYGVLSARGGMFGGDGGLIEVSSPIGLDYQPISTSTLAPNGKAGTLLLDPINLIIQAAGVDTNITQAPPFTYFPNAAGAILTTGTITGASGLTNGNVIIRTVGTGTAGLGNITVNSPILWSTGFSLTFDSANDILINNHVQQDTAVTGGVFLNAARNVVVSSAATTTAVGSRNALTSVNAGGDVTVIAAAGGNQSAQIGFFFDTMSAAGPITVSCTNLTTQSGTGAVSSAIIGHGRFNNSVMSFTLSTAATATIDINATGNILIRNSGGLNAISGIGHGAMLLAAGSAVSGDIAVSAAGNLSMNANFGAGGASCRIGLISQLPSGGVGGTFSGDIDIEVGNQIDLRGSDTVGSAAVQIGHGSVFPAANAVSMTGDIRICCNGSANLVAGITGGVRISHFTTSTTMAPPPDITGDIHFAIAGNLLMHINPSPLPNLSSCFIGYANAGVSPCTINTNMNVSVCGSATLSNPVGPANNLGIGTRSSSFIPGTTVNLVVGGDFIATNLSCNNFFVGNQAGNFNFGVGGDLTVSMNTAFPGAISGSLATNIFIGGSITATPNAAGGADSLTIGRAAVIFQTATLDVRAGGDITWPSSMIGGTTSYNILAGHTFAAGEIWNGNGLGFTSVTSQPAIFNPPCGLCLAFLMPSPAINPLCGSFSVSATTTPVSFTTTSSLTFSSLCTSCSGAPSSLTIGSAGDITFLGTVGALNVGPFNTVILAQNITSSSSISGSACHDLTVLPGTTITSTGLGAPIVLISDVDNSGAGNLNIQGNITSNNGQICLLAAPGSFGCDAQNCFSGTAGLLQMAVSSVNQTAGTISSGSGPVIIAASGDVLIDGAPTSITSTTGDISITANANLTINEDIISASGLITTFSSNDSSVNSALLSTSNEIRMIAGHNLSLTGTANIISTANTVTLVTDHLFPSAPLFGMGSFSMSCSSTITSGPGQPVRIFTSMQGLNSVCGGATINGFQLNNPFFGYPGTLFEDTAYEMWCTYFDCPYPYPFFGLGSPFTFFYKDCLQRITQQAMLVLDELLANLHPYNEFPGWEEEFWVKYDKLALEDLIDEPYMIRRRAINLINHPKSYTQLLPE